MILVDSSVWIDHFRKSDPQLSALLAEAQVLAHPFVTGELALGNFKARTTILRALQDLPQAPLAREEEVQHFIEQHALFGRGIGYIDVHLLASVRLRGGQTRLWTRDKRLEKIADLLDLRAPSA